MSVVTRQLTGPGKVPLRRLIKSVSRTMPSNATYRFPVNELKVPGRDASGFDSSDSAVDCFCCAEAALLVSAFCFLPCLAIAHWFQPELSFRFCRAWDSPASRLPLLSVPLKTQSFLSEGQVTLVYDLWNHVHAV